MAAAFCSHLQLNCMSTTIKVSPSSSSSRSTFRLSLSASALPSSNPKSVAIADPQPVFSSVRSFAPATIANLGPGFDFLGCAVDGIGDFVDLRVDPNVRPGEVSISDISGTGSKLSKNPLWNFSGIAAISVMKMLKIRSVGLSLSLEKGIPLGCGLGSSAAAAAVAVNELFGGPLSQSELVIAGLDSESKVSGYHADNVAPSIMGGLVLIRSYDPMEPMQLKFPYGKDLSFVLVNPLFEAPTKKMRAALPREITMSHHIWNCSQAGAYIGGLGVTGGCDRIRKSIVFR